MNKVSGIILLVSDINISLEFYEKLNFQVQKRVPGVAITVALDDFWIELLDKTKVVTESYKQQSNISNPGNGLFIQMIVSDVDSFYKELVSKKVQVLEGPADYPWGHRECIIRDPDGHIICVYSKI